MATSLEAFGVEERATLVADDQVQLRREGTRLLARCPDAIAGKIEVRGLGILAFPHVGEAEIGLVAQLGEGAPIDRLPDTRQQVALLGLDIPALVLAPFEASAPLKVLLALLPAVLQA
jgi:serine kinase of HPr protein (carbohydrate metabolism regulator)